VAKSRAAKNVAGVLLVITNEAMPFPLWSAPLADSSPSKSRDHQALQNMAFKHFLADRVEYLFV
jgi:hypothetical protein